MAGKSTATATGIVGEIDGLLTMGAAARILGVSHGHVKNLVNGSGELPTLPSVKLGAHRMVRRSDLAEFIASLEA